VGKNIALRPVTEADLPSFYEQQLDPAATEMGGLPSQEREPFMAHWHTIMADGSCILRTVLFDGRVAGNMVSFLYFDKREVGYWIGREYWGRGIATEALRQFLREIGTRPLYAHVAKRNIASRRVLEKCGFAPFASQAADAADEDVLVLER
jgi:RimJ/RimL family protein N-acetyltransferase